MPRSARWPFSGTPCSPRTTRRPSSISTSTPSSNWPTPGRSPSLNHLGSVRIFEPPRSIGPGLVVGPDLNESSAARLCRRRREGGRPRRPPGDVTAPRSAPGRCAGDRSPSPPHASASTRTPHKSPSASSPLSRRARRRMAPAGSPSGGEGRVRLVEADHGRLGATRWEAAVDFRLRRAGGIRVLPLGGGQRPGRCRSRRLRLGAIAGRRACPDSTSPVEPSWRPPASATTWPGEAAACRWSWWTACPVVWAATASCTRWSPVREMTTRLTGELAPHPLGIAHAAVVGGQLVIGFNRGGYRLHTVPLRTVSQLVRGLPARRA